MRAPNDGGEISCMFDVKNVCSSFQPRPLCFLRGQATPQGEDSVLLPPLEVNLGSPLSLRVFSHIFPQVLHIEENKLQLFVYLRLFWR